MFKYYKGFFALSSLVLAISGSLYCMEKGQGSSLELSPESFIRLPSKERDEAFNKLTPEAKRKLVLSAEPKHLEALRNEYLENLKKLKKEIKKSWIVGFKLDELYPGKEKTELEKRLNAIFEEATSPRGKKEKITLKQPGQGQMPFQGQQQYQGQQPYQGQNPSVERQPSQGQHYQVKPVQVQQPYQGRMSLLEELERYQGPRPSVVQQPSQGQPGYGQQQY